MSLIQDRAVFVTANTLNKTLEQAIIDGDLAGGGGSGVVTVDTFTGNGSQTDFTLSITPDAPEGVNVFISGVYQEKSTYTITGTLLSFSVAPPNGNSIEVLIGAVGLGFTAENTANKENATLDNSSVKYPTNNLVKTSIEARCPQTVIARRLTDFTTTSDVHSDTGLEFTIGANEVWAFEFIVQHGCNNTGGLKFQLTLPAGGGHRTRITSLTAGNNNFTSQVFGTGAETTITMNTINSAGQGAELKGTIINGVNAGVVSLQMRSVVLGQTSSVYKESYVVARKVG